MQGIAKILKKDGVAIISIPNSNGWGARVFKKRWINWHTPYHLQHFSKNSIYKIAEKANLEVVSLKTITSSEWLHYQWMSIISFPKLGEESAFWGYSKQERRFSMKVLHRLLLMMHKIKINHVITRFFDAIGYGDNYIFVLRKKEKL